MTEQTGIHVKLIGEDGNAFAIMGKVRSALRKAGLREQADQFMREATECGSYDELLNLVQETVEVD